MTSDGAQAPLTAVRQTTSDLPELAENMQALSNPPGAFLVLIGTLRRRTS